MSVSHAHTHNVSFDAEIKINCAKISSQAKQSKAYRRPAYAFPSSLPTPLFPHPPFIVNRTIVTREEWGGEGSTIVYTHCKSLGFYAAIKQRSNLLLLICLPFLNSIRIVEPVRVDRYLVIHVLTWGRS